ncbi:MAG: ABC transporter permease [Candidatus Acidiferrales bacterium]
MDTLLQDIRFAIRGLLKNPGFSAIAILTLALGIGANTALFSVMNALLLRTLPVHDPQQLVVLSDPESSGMQNGTNNGDRDLFTFHEFEGLRDNNQVFSGILTFASQVYQAPVATSDSGDGTQTGISLVSGSYFSTLGVEPMMGHAFGAEVDRGRGQFPQAILSYAFWRQHLHEDPGVIGRKIRIRKTLFEVIGVMPREFTGIVVGFSPEIWVPLTMQQAVVPGRDWLTQPPGSVTKTMFLHIVGRLKPGVTLSQANASINVTFHNVLKAEGDTIPDASIRGNITEGRIITRDARHGLSVLRGQYQKPLGVLMGLVGLLLLLACANVANLLLAKSAARQKELSVRVALGAGRGRLVRQLLTESVLLSAVGAAVGLLLARWGDQLLLRMVSGTSTPVPLDVHLDWAVMAFTIGVTLLTGVLFGLVPALRATRVDLNYVLRGASRGISGGERGSGRLPIGKVLVGAQVAISLLLLVAAGLFVRNIQNLTHIPLGYEAEHILMFRISPGANGYKPAAIAPLFQTLLAKFSAIPGASGVTLSENGLYFGTDSGDEISIRGMTAKKGQEMDAAYDQVGPHYFSTIGIPVLMGRDVEKQDESGARHCWINQTMAKYYFGNDNPLGRRILDMYPESHYEYEIVGVVADARPNALRGDITRRFFVPFFNPLDAAPNAVFEARFAGDSSALSSTIRQVVRETDAGLDPLVFRTVPALIDGRLVRDRLTAKLSSFFGLVALLLACIGLYGVLSYTVTRRTSEIGVRMALGAQRGNVLRLILQDALAVTLIGTVVGLEVTLGLTKLLESWSLLSGLFYGLSARDPLTLTVASVVLLAVATLAAFVPAWRASRTDPITALRYE